MPKKTEDKKVEQVEAKKVEVVKEEKCASQRAFGETEKKEETGKKEQTIV